MTTVLPFTTLFDSQGCATLRRTCKRFADACERLRTLVNALRIQTERLVVTSWTLGSNLKTGTLLLSIGEKLAVPSGRSLEGARALNFWKPRSDAERQVFNPCSMLIILFTQSPVLCDPRILSTHFHVIFYFILHQQPPRTVSVTRMPKPES